MVTGSTGNWAGSELLTRVLMLQFWSFKRSSLCFSGSKIHQHGWRRDFNARLRIFISEPLDCSFISLSFDIIFGRLVSQLFQFLFLFVWPPLQGHCIFPLRFHFDTYLWCLPLCHWLGEQGSRPPIRMRAGTSHISIGIEWEPTTHEGLEHSASQMSAFWSPEVQNK